MFFKTGINHGGLNSSGVGNLVTPVTKIGTKCPGRFISDLKYEPVCKAQG